MDEPEPIHETFASGLSLRGFLHSPERGSGEGIILTHGAGANCESLLLVSLAEALCASGMAVLRFDLPFRQMRPHGPPPRGSAERDQQGLLHAVEWLRQRYSGKIVLGGHSYGGRQASMLAARTPEFAEALLLLSYPLHPPNKPEQLRTEHFPALRTPAMFVHGSKDTFATHEEIQAAIGLIPAKTHLLSLPAAGHEIASKRNVTDVVQRIAEELSGFLGEG